MSNGAKKTRTVIPAQPGFDVVSLGHEPYSLGYTPIVAWVIETPDDYGHAEGSIASAYPVSVEWERNTDSSDIIRYPNGDIVFTDDRTFWKGQEAEALAYAVKQHERYAVLRELTPTGS